MLFHFDIIAVVSCGNAAIKNLLTYIPFMGEIEPSIHKMMVCVILTKAEEEAAIMKSSRLFNFQKIRIPRNYCPTKNLSSSTTNPAICNLRTTYL